MSVYRSAADLVSRVPQADPSMQAQFDSAKKVSAERQAVIQKQEEERQKYLDSINKAKEQGRVKGQAQVKAVLNGDCVVLVGKALQSNMLPPEKVMFLTGIAAPRLGRKGTQDEQFAWQAREFLRNLLIGKVVDFVVSHVHQGDGNDEARHYGSLFLGGEDVGKFLVSQGWAKVKAAKGEKIPEDRRELFELEERAKQQKLGLWNESVPESLKVRNVVYVEKDFRQVYDLLKKKNLRGVVDQVRDGSTLRIEVKYPDDLKNQTYYSFFVSLAGVQCEKVPLPYNVLYQQFLKLKETNPKAQPPRKEVAPRFSNEAKVFTELRLLNRDVDVKLLTVDKSGNFFGNVTLPQGNIVIPLLKNGFGKFIDWSAQLTSDAALYHAAERDAKHSRLNLWYNYKPELNRMDSKNRIEFAGKVVQVISGDTLIVATESLESRVSLSSIRAPRIGNQRQRTEDFAQEAKEYLRKKLIGHKVQVVVEYLKASEDSKEERPYAAVFYNKENVAESIVSEGLATVISHRVDEQRSVYYESLLAAEAKAESARRGMHSKTVPPAKIYNDLSEKVKAPKGPEGTESEEVSRKRKEIDVKQKQYLPFFQKQKFMEGIVEYVFGGNRFKILIPKENCIISFALAGIKCPLVSRQAGAGEPFAEDALKFSRDRVLQHDVRIEVESLDKGGNFVGSLIYHRANLSYDLLQAGLAQVFAPSADRSKHSEDLYRHQAQAKDNKIGLWLNWVEPEPVIEAPTADDAQGLEESKVVEEDSKLLNIYITEVLDPTSFYFQIKGKSQIEEIESKLAGFSDLSGESVTEPERGKLYAGFYGDSWYRCKFERYTDEEYEVFFVDYGNVDAVSQLRTLDPALSKIKPAASLGQLSALKSAKDYLDDALDAFGNLVYERELFARVDFFDRTAGKHHLTLQEYKDSDESINSFLLKLGLLRVANRPERRLIAFSKTLKADENVARKKHLGIWQYGDVSSDEE